jgi:hypothetical protein
MTHRAIAFIVAALAVAPSIAQTWLTSHISRMLEVWCLSVVAWMAAVLPLESAPSSRSVMRDGVTASHRTA